MPGLVNRFGYIRNINITGSARIEQDIIGNRMSLGAEPTDLILRTQGGNVGFIREDNSIRVTLTSTGGVGGQSLLQYALLDEGTPSTRWIVGTSTEIPAPSYIVYDSVLGMTQFRIRSGGQTELVGSSNDTTAAASNVHMTTGGRTMRSTSSKRYKTDIEPACDKLANILEEIEVVWYRSKCTADNPNWSYWGIIAEDLAKIDPRFVQWGYFEEDYEKILMSEEQETIFDDQGNIIQEYIPAIYDQQLKEDAEIKPVGVAYERLTTALIKGRQVDKKRIDNLEKENAEIKNRLSELEKTILKLMEK